MTFSVALHPPSPTITGVAIDWATARRLAPGSDNWPATWSSAGGGTVYAGWGDGGGFGGTGSVGRSATGVASISGTAPSGLVGTNLIGGLNPTIAVGIPSQTGFGIDPDHPGVINSKIITLLSLGATSVLTRFSRATSPAGGWKLAEWTTGTNSWRLASWFGNDQLAPYQSYGFVYGQAGRDYAEAPDGFIYAMRGRGVFPAEDVFSMFLSRCPTAAADKLVESAWQHYSGVPGAPAWSSDPAAAQPVATFQPADDPAQAGIQNNQATWVRPLGRWIITCCGNAADGRLRFYEATALWSEWRLIGTVQAPPNAPGAGAGTAFGVTLPSHALAADGKSGLALVTGTGGYDALTAATFTLTTAVVVGGMPQLRNFPYAYAVGLSTASPPVLTLTQFDASTGVTRAITWTSALLASLASPPSGAFGWVDSPGRVVEITDERITPPASVDAAAVLAMPGLGVTATATSIGGHGWPNGYATRRTFVAPSQDDLAAATLVDFILEFDTDELPAQDWSWLASEFLSVVGGVPFDLRFETVPPVTNPPTPAAKIDHWVMLYTASPPRLVWRMRVPAPGLRTGASGVAFPFRLYSGKAGVAATEENRNGVFAGVLAARVFPSGQDVSGKGRHLTTVSGVTAGTVDGLPGGVFGSASFARLQNPTWLDRVAALTEVVMVAAGANTRSGNFWRAGGIGTGTARASTFLEIDAFEPGWNAASGSPPSQAGGNNAVLGPANSVVSGETHLWQFDRSSGANCHIYRDEAALPATYVGTGSPTAPGFIFTQPLDNEGYGAGTGAQMTAMLGTYGLAELWPKVLGPAWAATNARCRLDPRSLVGVGDPDLATDPSTGPVAVPVRATIVGDTTLDVAALAYDEQSPRTVALLSVTGTDPNCAASVVGGQALLRPAAGTVLAPATVDYVVGKGPKRSTSRLLLTVSGSGPPPPPPPGDAWRDPLTGWAAIPPLSQVSGPIVPINSNADLPRMSPGVPGTTYVIGGNLTGSVTVSGRGTPAAPIVIRGAYDGPDRARFPKWTGSQSLTINGASHVYLHKLCFVGAGNTSSNGQVATTGRSSYISIERCWSYGQTSTSLYETPAYRCDDGTGIRYYRIRYCEHGNPNVRTAAGLWTMGDVRNNPAPAQNMFFYRNLIAYMDDSGAGSNYGSVVFSIGRGENGDGIDHKTAFYENRIRDMINIGETVEMKDSGSVQAYNTLEQSPNLMALRFRHGHDGFMIGNVFVFGSGGAGMEIECRGSGHTIINNWAVSLSAGAQVAANSAAGPGNLVLWGGNVDGSMPLGLVRSEIAASPRPNNIADQVGGNRMAVIIGRSNSQDGALPLGSPLNVVGPAAGGSSVPYRNRSVSVMGNGDADYYGRGQSRTQYGGRSPAYGTHRGGSSTIYNRAITDADYDLVPVRLFDADVGIACTVYP